MSGVLGRSAPGVGDVRRHADGAEEVWDGLCWYALRPAYHAGEAAGRAICGYGEPTRAERLAQVAHAVRCGIMPVAEAHEAYMGMEDQSVGQVSPQAPKRTGALKTSLDVCTGDIMAAAEFNTLVEQTGFSADAIAQLTHAVQQFGTTLEAGAEAAAAMADHLVAAAAAEHDARRDLLVFNVDPRQFAPPMRVGSQVRIRPGLPDRYVDDVVCTVRMVLNVHGRLFSLLTPDGAVREWYREYELVPASDAPPPPAASVVRGIDLTLEA